MKTLTSLLLNKYKQSKSQLYRGVDLSAKAAGTKLGESDFRPTDNEAHHSVSPRTIIDHIYTLTADRGCGGSMGCTGSGGHLTKHNPCGPLGIKQQPYIMPEAIRHPGRSI